MLTREEYIEQLEEQLDIYRELMQKSWGEVPILKPVIQNVLKVRMDFDLGDFPHEGQTFIVDPRNVETKFTPVKVAKTIVREVNSHRNLCNRCGVPTPWIYSRRFGRNDSWLGKKNYRTGLNWTQEELDMYNLPPDSLERKIHPTYSRQLDERLAKQKAAEELAHETLVKIQNPDDLDYAKELNNL